MLIFNNDQGLKKFIFELKKLYDFKYIVFFSYKYLNYLKKFFNFKIIPFPILADNLKTNENYEFPKKIINQTIRQIKMSNSNSNLNFFLKIYFNNYLFYYINDLVNSTTNLFKLLNARKPSLILCRMSDDIGYSLGEISKK